MKQASIGSPYRVPPEPRRWSAITLAVAVHALLLAFLFIGINWQNNKPAAVEAEVWDMKVQSAAPPPPPPVQEAQPEPEPEPAPPPKVVEQPAPPAPAPDIKLEQEKKRKEELRKKELAEQKAREEEKRELAEKKEAEKKAKVEAERKAQELADKKEAEKKEKAEKLAKEKAEKLAKAKADAAAKAQKEAIRKQEMARMLAQAGAGTSGTAAKSTAPRIDASYEALLAAKIKSNTHYIGDTNAAGNPRVEFQVDVLPTGEVISVRKTKSSGIPVFDDAVERGIHSSSPLPKKKDGTVERSFPISFKLKDLE
jgi:colicin import membrane protein